MFGGMETVFTTLIVVAVLFLLFRGLTLWYWRINALHDELVKLNGQLASVHAQLTDIHEVAAKWNGRA